MTNSDPYLEFVDIYSYECECPLSHGRESTRLVEIPFPGQKWRKTVAEAEADLINHILAVRSRSDASFFPPCRARLVEQMIEYRGLQR